jgi:hypothetical protein
VRQVHVVGAARTRDRTVRELLRRPPPARYSDREIDDWVRRVSNLEAFDDVALRRHDGALELVVQEKWTLLPLIDFQSGRTLGDARILLGLTETNLLGTGNGLTVTFARAERGFGGTALFEEHPYRHHRWALGTKFEAASASYRFADGAQFRTRSARLDLYGTSPPVVSPYANFRVGIGLSRLRILDTQGDVPGGTSHAVETFCALHWDAYSWHDTSPHGVRAQLGAGTGALVATGRTEPRHFVEGRIEGAARIGPRTIIAVRGMAGVVTRGNAAYSFLVGGVEGVRGLDDAYYRNWLSSYGNLELRHAEYVAPRWAVQGVLFADGAVFEQVSKSGARGSVGVAAALGAGLRIIPTWLAATVLRLDVGRLLVPTPRLAWQIGLSQYY